MPRDNYYLPQRALISQDNAALIQKANVPRSKFTNSWSRITAFTSGKLVPILLDEVLPGDHLTYEITAMVRMATPLFPIFSRQRVETFFFYVPNRILWDNWVRFMGEQDNPADSIAFTVPTINLTAAQILSNEIYDHMGIPVGIMAGGQSYDINALPFRAYNKIWNDWFRDQNLQNSVAELTDNGPDNQNNYILLRRAKQHDYFTSALPWAQKFTNAFAPLSGQAEIRGIGAAFGAAVNAGPTTFYETGLPAGTSYQNWYDPLNAASIGIKATFPGGGAQNMPLIYADLSTATGVTVTTLRQAFMVQSLLERDARGGTRYPELIRAHFGVINPDFRVQRPEYIGGGSTPLDITPVAQTAPTAGQTLGYLGGAGTAAGAHRASYAATEHGWIIGLINVRAELHYQQGIHRSLTRSTRYDYYWPELAEVGEQTILMQEIYATGDPTNDNNTFGYQERYHEYRTRYSETTGLMRSNASGTLDAWHLGQKFLAAPTLGDTFIKENAPVDRVIAAGVLGSDQQYLADILYNRTAVRPIPTFGTPASIGRF